MDHFDERTQYSTIVMHSYYCIAVENHVVAFEQVADGKLIEANLAHRAPALVSQRWRQQLEDRQARVHQVYGGALGERNLHDRPHRPREFSFFILCQAPVIGPTGLPSAEPFLLLNFRLSK